MAANPRQCEDWAFKMQNKTRADFCYKAGDYNVFNTGGEEFTACYRYNRTKGESPWLVSPMTNYLPVLVLQLCIIIFTFRLVVIFLKPFHQPRLVSAILGGMLVGATMFGQFPEMAVHIFPFRGAVVLESVSNLGLTYYMFLVGLEMDLTPIRHVGSKALSISMAGILLPIAAGMASYQLFTYHSQPSNSHNIGQYFWAIALTVTSFPDLARLLSDFKLMQTDLGKTALISGLVNDIASWALLVIAITIFNQKNGDGASSNVVLILRLLPTLVFIPFFWFVARPAVSWLISYSVDSKTPSAETTTTTTSSCKYRESHVYCIIAAVAFFGFITDACGSHSMVGAFMLGLIIPPGELGTLVMEKLEEFVTGILLPAFFLTNGLRINIPMLIIDISNGENLNGYAVLGSIALSCSIKVISTWLVSLFLGFKHVDGFVLGVLMNTKGVLALIIINLGRDLLGFDQNSFSTIILIYLLMTISVGPLIMLVYKPALRLKQYKQRTLERSSPNSELRVITCVHSSRNVTSTINLLQALNPTRRSPIFVFALRLVELTGRAAAAMLIVHDTLKSSGENSEDNLIISAFQNLDQEYSGGFLIQPLTVVSPYTSMHQDIINLAAEKCVSFIIIPFHQQPTADGRLEEGNPSIRQMNLNLLASSPCSVGLLFDRGLGSILRVGSSRDGRPHLRIAMLFVGGADDREALAFSWRMARNLGVTLNVVRLLPGKDAIKNIDRKCEYERQIDDAYVNEFRFKTMTNEAVTFLERQVDGVEEAVKAIKTSYDEFDLYVVGRGKERSSALTSGLADWSECPELGAIGDILVQSDFPSLPSVLVVQQYIYASTPSNGASAAEMAFVNHRKRDDDYY